MKPNKYSWHLNHNISTCSTAPGALQTLSEHYQQAEIWGSCPSGALTCMCSTAWRASRALPAALRSPHNAGAHLHPAWFLPGCSCGQWCPGLALQPSPVRQKDPDKMPPTGGYPSSQQTASAFELSSAFGKESQEKKQLTFGHLEAWGLHSCTSLPSVTYAPHCTTCSVHTDMARAGQPQGPAW